MEKLKKIRKTVFIGMGIGFVIFITYQFHQLKVANSKNPSTILYAAPKDYLNIFTDSAKKKLNVTITYSFKSKKTISLFSYNKNYSIEIIKIDTINNLSFDNSLFEQPNHGNPTVSGYFFPFERNGFITNYNMMSSGMPKKIYLSLQGDRIETIIKNDSTACYFLNCNKFSIRYRQDGIVEIYGNPKSTVFLSNNNETPFSLMFLKRNHCLYFLQLFSIDLKEKFESKLLYKLVTTEK